MYKNICPTHLFQLVSLVQQFDELVPGEVEQVGHLGLGAVEVLDAEGVDGDLPDAELAAPLQRLRQLLEARPVARDDLPMCKSDHELLLHYSERTNKILP